jgi:hypothetical protein
VLEGTLQLQVLCVARREEPLLDGGPPWPSGFALPGGLPPLRPRARDASAPAPWVCGGEGDLGLGPEAVGQVGLAP